MLLNSSLKISSSVELKNRVVVPPMASQTANNDGHVTQDTLAHYHRLAQSRAGLVMVEYTYIHLEGKSEANQLGINSDEHILGLKELAQVIKHAGSKSAIQLTHAGAKTQRELTGGVLISPSGIPIPIKDTTLETPDAANMTDIFEIKQSFVLAAKRAITAGFDIIELHAAHGYGLNQWLSPITNQRNDSYGGSLEARARLLFEIISEIKAEVSDVVLSVRIPGMDHHPEGITYEDTKWLAKKLEALGVAILNVSSGIGGWRRPEARVGEGYLVNDAAIIAQSVSLPVIGVGGIQSAEYINQALAEKNFSLAAVGRAILNDPSWGEKNGVI